MEIGTASITITPAAEAFLSLFFFLAEGGA
jgi:hypothetical protein